ncbi:MAG: hypothetical protein JWM97_29 [Phycisphaerales bacterium]|nr:hypothetical protein [Phycisphaerales bacterium]
MDWREEVLSAGRANAYELPINIPVKNTSTPPSTTWIVAETHGDSI